VLAAGTVIKCASGESVTIVKTFTPGGQGCAYLVRRTRSGTPGVLKLFHDRFDRAETQRRLEYLIAQRLHRLCPVLIGPRDLVVGPSGVGYVAELFPGEPLEEVLSHPVVCSPFQLDTLGPRMGPRKAAGDGGIPSEVRRPEGIHGRFQAGDRRPDRLG
jgi:hypothetical protein